jgi:hypothetical protein
LDEDRLPAYEWAFGDVNPPVHAWAAWRVHKVEMKRSGRGDRQFLERIFQKLLLNFTWWVNRKDTEGRNVFQAGWRDLIPFHEYFHGDNGADIGASHQTGWTARVAKLIQQYGE